MKDRPPGLQERLAGRQRTVGLVMPSRDLEVLEQVPNLGFDVVLLDWEHAVWDWGEAREFVRAASLAGIPVVVRAPFDAVPIGWLLDLGVGGLQLPHVTGPEDLTAVADEALFPPRGRRGAGRSRGLVFGNVAPSDLSSFDPVIIAQIEDPAGIRRADAIASHPNIDAVVFGLLDLAVSLGAGDVQAAWDRDDVQAAIEAVRRNGVPYGLPASSKSAVDSALLGGATLIWVHLYSVVDAGARLIIGSTED